MSVAEIVAVIEEGESGVTYAKEVVLLELLLLNLNPPIVVL